MRYAINVDKPTSTAMIHKVTCRYYINRKAKIASDGYWTTPLKSLQAATLRAEETDCKTADKAKCCY